jgi:hypothetical protein
VQEDLLPRADVAAGVEDAPAGVHDAVGRGRLGLIGPVGQQSEDEEPEEHDQHDGLDPGLRYEQLPSARRLHAGPPPASSVAATAAAGEMHIRDDSFLLVRQ